MPSATASKPTEEIRSIAASTDGGPAMGRKVRRNGDVAGGGWGGCFLLLPVETGMAKETSSAEKERVTLLEIR